MEQYFYIAYADLVNGQPDYDRVCRYKTRASTRTEAARKVAAEVCIQIRHVYTSEEVSRYDGVRRNKCMEVEDISDSEYSHLVYEI